MKVNGAAMYRTRNRYSSIMACIGHQVINKMRRYTCDDFIDQANAVLRAKEKNVKK